MRKDELLRYSIAKSPTKPGKTKTHHGDTEARRNTEKKQNQAHRRGTETRERIKTFLPLIFAEER